MKTELETRIAEIEKGLATTELGSDKYGAMVKDHETLVKSKNALHESEMKDFRWQQEHAEEKLERERQHDENLKKIELEERKNSKLRDFLTIALGTWVPFGAYMAWEERHVISGKATNFIGKIFKR